MNEIDKLIKALGDSDWYVRNNVTEALGKIGSPAVEPLIRAIVGNGDSVVRKKVAEALGKISDARAVEPLINALGDEKYYVRKCAAWALGNIGDARAVEPLIKALRDSDVQENATEALEKIGAPAVEPLIRVLGDKDSDVREKAAEALGKLNWNPKNDIEKAYYFIATTDWESVVSIGGPAIEPLTKVQGYNNADIQKNVTGALNKIYPQITEIIFGEISSNNTKTRVKNLETSQLTMPMSSLVKVHIDADTYDFDMVERFITYSINYVGQKHLRKKVEVHIYGNPEKLHPNLLNSFKNLCKKVIIQSK